MIENDAGDLSASDSADYWGLQGLKSVIDDNAAIYVQDDTPNDETQYRTRFYMNPNSLTMAVGDILDIFTGRNAAGTDVLRIQLQKTAASYQIRSGLLNDAGTWTDTNWYDIPNNWTAVEIHYQAFANSGSLTLWLDDVQKQSITFVDNDTRTITDIRLGAQGVDAGTSGTLYFDDFESRRFSYIGTLPDPGVNDPTATNQAGWFTRTYAYSASIPHAVTSVSPETGTPDTYQYDANGNMTCRIENGVTYTHAYNAENRASSIAKRNTDCTGTIIESWSFAYDGDGTRVLTAHFTGTQGTPDSVTSYFMGGQYEVKDGATKKYYSIAGMTVAMHDGSAVQYLLTDHLGSTVAVTNASGTLTSQSRYLPFGGVRSIPNSPILSTDFGYTGQRLLDSGMGGIMDYKARFYSVGLGRFVQPDSIIPDQSNPQSWNRFGYVQNNPVRFNDPTGHMLDDGCRWIGCGGGPSTPIPPDPPVGGSCSEDDDACLLNDNSGTPQEEPNCWVQITTENYWANICGGDNGSDFTHIEVANPGYTSKHLIMDYDSGNYFMLSVLAFTIPSLISSTNFRAPWKIFTKNALDQSADLAMSSSTASIKTWDDVLAAYIAKAGDDANKAGAHGVDVFLISNVYNQDTDIVGSHFEESTQFIILIKPEGVSSYQPIYLDEYYLPEVQLYFGG